MNYKTSNKNINLNHLNLKNNQKKIPLQKKPSQSNNEDLKPISDREKEIPSQNLISNKSQISEVDILYNNNDKYRVKTYKIQSDEQISFLLNFELVKEKTKISVIEKDSFPQNKYENYYSLEDFIKINKWFNIFYNIESLLTEFEQLTKNEYFTIEQKNKNVLSLFIIFPIDLLDKIEIQLPINEINNLDLFSQLISKITEIESKENNEISFFDEKIDNLGHLLQSIEEANKAREEELLQNQQNENEILNNEENKENKEEKSDNKSNKSNTNLEEMKDALKLQIEKKIKNDTETKNLNELNNNALIKDNNKEVEEESHEENKEQEQEELLLPLDPNNIPFTESSIISTTDSQKNKELRLLSIWLVQTLHSNFTTKLIFSSDKEDDKASSFHKKCDNIAPTLTLIETKEGFRYGGFTTQSWESTEQSIFKKDKSAFIFSLDTEKKYEITNEEKSIQCSMYWGPYFGEGGAICVPDNFLEEKNAFYQWPSSYDIAEKDELTFGQEHNINISKYEVFEIVIINDENNSDGNDKENEEDKNNDNNNNEENNVDDANDIKEIAPRKFDEDDK